jgi:small subunit ribosomal protein S14
VAKKSKIAKAKRTPKFSTRRNAAARCVAGPVPFIASSDLPDRFRKLADQGLIPGVRKSSW